MSNFKKKRNQAINNIKWLLNANDVLLVFYGNSFRDILWRGYQ
jgi:hypothetical protein